jgi:hypothetical protein
MKIHALKGGSNMKWLFTCLLAVMVLALLSGCTSSGDVSESTTEEIEVTSEFGRMLGLVPYSFLEKHDIWFGDPETAKQLYGFDNIKSLDDLMALAPEDRKRMVNGLSGVAWAYIKGNFFQVVPYVGFDPYMVDRAVFYESVPPWNFRISEGNFDKDLIASKLIEQGYEKVGYGPYSYYSISGDFGINLQSPISQQVLAELNRIAVLDDTLVTAPATDIMTAILNTMAGSEASVIDDPTCWALADSVGNVLSAAIVTPERVLNPGVRSGMPPFDFTIPGDWSLLHKYDMVCLGFKNDGQERYWVISLYYTDEADAQADAQELVTRMKSYVFNTQFEQTPGRSFKRSPLTDMFEVGEPEIQSYPEGATLTVECRYKPETGGSAWYMPVMDTRDLLFLALDPAPYLKK